MYYSPPDTGDVAVPEPALPLEISVLKLGRVSRSPRNGGKNTQGGTTICIHFPAAQKFAPG